MNFEMEKTPARQVYNLLIGLVAPRPIAWITSMDNEGRLNAAPFSAYNYLCTDPPIVGIGVTNRPGRDAVPKDTARNIRRTGQFVINVVTEDLIQQMNICATDFPAEINELEMAGLTTAPSVRRQSPAHRRGPRRAGMHRVHHDGDWPLAHHPGPRRGNVCRGPLRRPARRTAHGPYIKAEELHAIGRMNGLGNYVHTRDSLPHRPAHLVRRVAKRQAITSHRRLIARRRDPRTAAVINPAIRPPNAPTMPNPACVPYLRPHRKIRCLLHAKNLRHMHTAASAC